MAGSGEVIERSVTVPVGVEDAFAWHERPGALERLIPPWERVEVLEHSGGIAEGARVVIRLHEGPVAIRWVARHRDFQPGRRFVDEQVEGPFARWVHAHSFDPEGAASCRVSDRIELTLPAAAAGRLALPLVRRRVERMLAYRHEVLAGDFAAHARYRDRPRLTVAVTGAGGLLGRTLVPFLTTGGHRVVTITRRPRGADQIGWDPGSGRLDASGIDGVDAVVHLAGEPIGVRWTAARKRRIRESRVRGTRLLAEALARLPRPPRVLVSASGIGVYGNRGDALLTEASPIPEGSPDFLVDVGREWEAAADPARAAGIRVVSTRFGLILTPAGGALGRMLPAFRLGVGGPLGSGGQWVSWAAIDDVVGAVHHAIMTEGLSGALNVCAPEPVTSRVFAETLGAVLGRPAVLPAPAPALRLLFGEMADTALLASQRAAPTRLLESGYRFRFPALEPALRFLLGR
jgi:uncharacterized protein (TIGR01777 family)